MALLYAFEHQNQVHLQIRGQHARLIEQQSATTENTPLVVYTPISNVTIVTLNFVLAMLVALISLDINNQIEHVQAPRFVP